MTGAVLIAEDDAPMRSLLASALARRGYSVETTEDGETAAGAAETGRFDLVLLDLVMPRADGMTTLRRLRRRFDPVQLPVVMLTGVGESAAVVAALEAGANDYVTKPFDLAVVLARVRTQVTLRRQSAALQEAGERLRLELEAAARVQQASLPPPDPAFGDYRFAWRYEPCEQLSGDGMNIVAVTPRHVAFYVFDVTGHGVRAALLSAAVGRLLLPVSEAGIVSEPTSPGRASRGQPAAVSAVRPCQVVTRLARRFSQQTAEGQFFTLAYGLLDTYSGELTYASAGHPAPIYLPAGEAPRRLRLGGMLIGVDADLEPAYVDHTIRLNPGDRLVLHTDGITEARSRDGELFGDARLLRSIAKADGGLAGMLDVVASDCRDWTGGEEGGDDRTLLAVERVAR